MKTPIRLLLAAVLLFTGLRASGADGYSFGFTVAQKNGGGSRTESYGDVTKNQRLLYTVTIENKSFKDVENVEVKYVTFSMQTQLGEVTTGHPALTRHPGTVPAFKIIKHNGKVTFETEGVMLTSTNYVYGYYADVRSKGALRGIWVRLYVGGQMIAEYKEPATLSERETFDDPPKPKAN